jgi:ACS family hexuronate transporter-like MFS transporter
VTPTTFDRVEATSITGIGRYRWVICALLFTAATVNYIDRQVLGVLKTTLQAEIGYNDVDYGNIVTAFQASYALGMVMVGRLLDRIGTRRGFTLAVGVWSIAAAAHALASSALGFSVARFALGLGESGFFPGAVKTVAEWFPKKERALATGLFNSGTNIGAIVCPLVVPWIAVTWGWRVAFLVTGALGGVWLVAWLKFYAPLAQHPRVTPEERAYIQSEPSQQTEKIAWVALLPHRQTWAFAVGKFLTDPFWWLYLFWVPDFLHRNHGLNLKQIGAPLVAIYLLSDAGSIAGGWMSSTLIRRGWTANAARKSAMLVCALGVTPIYLATQTHSLWTAVLLIGLATASHQGFSANLFTLTTDMFPAQAVGSAVGIGGMAGGIGGMFIAQLAGRLLQVTNSYAILFICAGSAYLLALSIIHLLAPRLEPVRLQPVEGRAT